MRRRRGVARGALGLAAGLGLAACPVAEPLRILEPRQGQLSPPGPLAVVLGLPPGADPASLALLLDGEERSGALSLTPDGRRAEGALSAVDEGLHRLAARVAAPGCPAGGCRAEVEFRAVALRDPDVCEVLNDAECLLPYPSSRFLAPAADTPSGFRLALPERGMPSQLGARIPAQPFAVRDGFSPTVQVLMHLPAGVDLEASGAARLWAEPSRSTDLTSLSLARSPSLLLEWESGQPVLHWLESDVVAQDPARRVLFLRPARSLAPGRRYVVVLRDLVDPRGEAVEPELAFRALREGLPTTISGIESRRAHFEEIFARLAQLGIARERLVLAFDFRVASDENLTGQMLSMRDQAFAWLAERDQNVPEQRSFRVESVTTRDCGQPGALVWRVVRGSFDVPLFLDSDPETAPIAPGFLRLGPDGFSPAFAGVTRPPYAIAISCDVLRPGARVHPLVYGHGLFGNGPEDVVGLADTTADLAEAFGLDAFPYIVGGTNWRGLSDPDFDGIDRPSFIVNSVVLALGRSFSALPDRLRQGQLNALVLGRLMKSGAFNAHEAFHAPDGRPVFPGPQEEAYYLGASLGGIMGLMFAALSPDVVAANVDVPAINFSILLQRSVLWEPFQRAFDLTVGSDPMTQLVLLGLLHELWVTGESAASATHVTADPLPGTHAKRILMTMAFLDHQVSNQGTEIAARTLGLSSLRGSLLDGLPEIPDRQGPLESAFVVYDTGSFDLADPAHAPFVPPLVNAPPPRNSACDPHGRRFFVPASLDQLLHFLRPGGAVENFCYGRCDADPRIVFFRDDGRPFRPELPAGRAAPCDPLAPTPLFD